MNKRKNIKIYITFAAIMLVCLFGGYFTGRFAGNIKETIDKINWNVITEKIYLPSAIIFIGLTLVMYGISFGIYSFANRKYKELEVMDDEIFETGIMDVEMALNKSMIISTVALIFSLLMFSVVVLCRETAEMSGGEMSSAGVVSAEICFFVVMALSMTVSTLIVSLEKKINPEKKGNVFDIHFMKKWLGSMDEGELMKIARGAQKAYIAGIITGMILWVISFVCMLTFHTGIMPIICITVMMIVMVIVGELNSK